MRIPVLLSFAVVSVAFVAWGASSAPPNLAKAIEAQRARALERPQDAQVLNDLGNLLVLAGDATGARTSYESALELAPDLTAAHYNLGLLLQQKGENRRALAAFKKVLKAEPENAWAHFQAAALYELGGSDSAAVAHYADAFRLNPQLSFYEVNPQVIDSKLVTRSLLKAHRNSPLESAAPRDYEQPSRIVALMVPQPSAAAATVADPAVAPAAGASTRTPAARPAAAPSQGAAPGASRTLGPADLEGEGGRSSSAGAGTVRSGGTRVVTPPPSGNFTRPRIAPGVQPGPPPEPPRYTPPPPSDEVAEPSLTDDPNGGQRLRFIPGIQSSGRLEMKLVPDAPPADGQGRVAP